MVVVGSGVSVSPAAKRPVRPGFGLGIIDGELGNRGVYPGGAAFADTGTDSIGAKDGMHTVDDSLIELLLAERISLMDAMAHARDPNFVKEEFQKALKSQRKGWFAGMFRK